MKQPMSFLGLESPVQGILDSGSRFHSRQIGYTALLNHQTFEQERQLKQPLPFPAFEENQPLMDELLEQLLSCSEFGGLSKVPLNSGSGIPASNLGEASMVAHQDNHTLLDMPSISGGFMDRIERNFPLTWNSGSIMSNASLMNSPATSVVSERSTGVRDGLLSPITSQPYVGSVPNFQIFPGDTPPEIPNLQMDQTSSQIHLLGKRRHNPGLSTDESSLPSLALEKLFHLPGGDQAGKSQIGRTVSQLSAQDITAASQDISNQSQGSEAGPHQAHTKVQNSITAGPSRPRVRARRGQATDPHSIAERLRRERIAERMRSLQELVPNSNKTDKASMMDEIIEYVKFLQLQVKVLSMSRLGGARAVTPSIAGLQYEGLDETGATNNARSSEHGYPSEDGVSLTEQQIAQLMEDDMGIAMQYLQSKGMCLMPIALANAISGKGNRQHSGNKATVSEKAVNIRNDLALKNNLYASEHMQLLMEQS